MKIISVNHETLRRGWNAYSQYKATILAGRVVKHEDKDTRARAGGIELIPGTVEALIAEGVRNRDLIVHAASRVSRCRVRTTDAVIKALTGSDPNENFWKAKGNDLLPHKIYGGELPSFLMAD